MNDKKASCIPHEIKRDDEKASCIPHEVKQDEDDLKEYCFEPSGVIDTATALSFARLCKENGLSREQARSQYDWMCRKAHQYGNAEDAMRRAWVDSLRADLEFGGNRFEQTVIDAGRVLDRFDTDGTVRELLESSGYGDNPEVIKLCARVGRVLSEDRHIGNGKYASERLSLAKRLYPEM